MGAISYVRNRKRELFSRGNSGAKAFVTRRNRRYLPRLMPKAIARNKTRKAASKRFKITGTGKVMRQHASRRHLLSSKSGKRKRHMAKSAEVDKTDVYRIKSNMPFA
jgi:large subunit ribosomal protein L35